MEPEPERRIIRAPGSRAPHHFSGRRLRQRGEFFALLEPRYAARSRYGTYRPPRGTGRNTKYYLLRLRVRSVFCARLQRLCGQKPPWAPLPVVPAGVAPVVRPLLGVAKLCGRARPGEATIAGPPALAPVARLHEDVDVRQRIVQLAHRDAQALATDGGMPARAGPISTQKMF